MSSAVAFLGGQAPLRPSQLVQPPHASHDVRPPMSSPSQSGAEGSSGLAVALAGPVVVAALAATLRRRGVARRGGARSRYVQLHATEVEMETKTNLAPWELDEETEEEKQDRYKREADEMKLKWDARRLEEKQSAARRRANAAKEKERSALYGPRDLIMDAYDARMYEEARVIEVRRKQREVYERIKAHKRGDALPPKGEPYVHLRPTPVQPPTPEDFDVRGRYDPDAESIDKVYRAPESYVSPTGPAPPPRHLRGAPRAAWEDPPYGPPPRNAAPGPGGPPPAGAPPPSSAPPPSAAPPSKPPPAPAAKKEEPAAAPAPAPAAAPAPEAPAAAGDLPTADEAKSMKVPELKDALKKGGLPVSGTKKVLLERLLDAIGS